VEVKKMERKGRKRRKKKKTKIMLEKTRMI